MRRIIAWSLALLLSVGVTAPWGAGAVEIEPEPPYEGYLFRLREDYPVLMDLDELPQGVAAVEADMGVYKAETREAIAAFVPGEAVAYIEPDYVVTLFEGKPDDTKYILQWDMPAVGAEYAWTYGLDGAGVTVGVIDSGLNPAHEDIDYTHILPGYNFYSNNSDTADYYGHGTFAAGALCAVTNNGVGLAGLANGVTLVPLKAFESKTTTMGKIVSALYAAVDEYRCDVVNMSFCFPGTVGSVMSLEAAVNYADARGVILVAAVGNDSSAQLNYPAAFDNVVGVGSVDRDLNRAGTSNYNESVFVTAPGDRVCGLWWGEADGYRVWSGTSFSAPRVAAAAALAKSVDPTLDGSAFQDLLRTTTTDLGPTGWDREFGWGLLSIPALLDAVGAAPRLKSAALERDETHATAKAEFSGLGAGQKAELLAAAYGPNGRLESATRAPAVTGELGGLSVEAKLPTGSDTQMVRLFLLDPESGAPLLAPVELATGGSPGPLPEGGDG